MGRMWTTLLSVFAVCATLLFTTEIPAGDWPQILGPNRTGIAASDEKLADSWPKTGPKTVWEKEVGTGLSGVAVAGDTLILTHRVGNEDLIECLNATTGKTLWKQAYRTSYRPGFIRDNGPRAVPVIHDQRVITYSALGQLRCFKLADGTLLWEKETHKLYQAPEGYFGAGSSPLVTEEKVIVNVGGNQDDSSVVAFSLKDGTEIWKSYTDKASYSSPVLITIGEVEHLLVLTRLNLVSLNPATGKLRFEMPFGKRGPTVTAANPILLNGDHLFLTASYGIGASYLKVSETKVEELWNSDELMSSQYTTPILHEGFLYAMHGRQDQGVASLVCLNPKTKSVVWEEANFGYATLILADGKLLALKTSGELVMVALSSKGYKELNQATPFPTTVRALPALANGFLYARDEDTLKCLDLRAAKSE